MGQPLRRGKRIYKKHNKVGLVIAVTAIVAVLVVGVVLISLSGSGDDTPPSSGMMETTPTTGKTLPKSFIDRNTASPYVILADVTNGKTLYAKNADQKCYPASMTKLLTAIVAAEAMPADTACTVGDEIYLIDPQSSRAYLTVGTRLTTKNLLQALLLPSGNDAAYAIAVATGRHIAGDDTLDKYAALKLFMEQMNKKAAALGCTNTHFSNPDGIHAADHYTTAADMLKIAACALQNELIAEVVSTPTVNTVLLSGQSVTWKNSNRLVQENNAYSYAGATGLKTGSTDEAGYCLAASATREGKSCIAIVMGAEEESGRWEDASGLLDISFQ